MWPPQKTTPCIGRQETRSTRPREVRWHGCGTTAPRLRKLADDAPPFGTVAQTQQLIQHSQFAATNAITLVSCVGLLQPKPKHLAGQLTFHRFRCHLSGAYGDATATVVLTGNGRFNMLPR